MKTPRTDNGAFNRRRDGTVFAAGGQNFISASQCTQLGAIHESPDNDCSNRMHSRAGSVHPRSARHLRRVQAAEDKRCRVQAAAPKRNAAAGARRAAQAAPSGANRQRSGRFNRLCCAVRRMREGLPPVDDGQISISISANKFTKQRALREAPLTGSASLYGMTADPAPRDGLRPDGKVYPNSTIQKKALYPPRSGRYTRPRRDAANVGRLCCAVCRPLRRCDARGRLSPDPDISSRARNPRLCATDDEKGNGFLVASSSE